jgi:cell division septum initiation protein DivIVA
MVDSGERHSIESRATTLQALLDLETVIAEVKEQRESIDNLRERVKEAWIGEDNPKNNIA